MTEASVGVEMTETTELQVFHQPTSQWFEIHDLRAGTLEPGGPQNLLEDHDMAVFMQFLF